MLLLHFEIFGARCFAIPIAANFSVIPPYLFSITLQRYIKCDYFTSRSLDPAISPPQWQQTSQCHSPIPIFNYMNKLRIDEPSTLDDLEDINSLIDTEVGVENLNQNEFENNQLMAQFQQDMAKIKVCEFLM